MNKLNIAKGRWVRALRVSGKGSKVVLLGLFIRFSILFFYRDRDEDLDDSDYDLDLVDSVDSVDWPGRLNAF